MKFKGCIKRGFDTEELARRSIEKIAKTKNPNDKQPRNTYLCQFCCKWHLTSFGKKRSEAIEKSKNKDFTEEVFINIEAQHWERIFNAKQPRETPKFKQGKGSPLYRNDKK